ncbi:MAG: hypothetical protein E7284_05265 [Lachnospiraceae bacterium]|nr:hypothetical protein [Lachnospiraceae bacterium]
MKKRTLKRAIIACTLILTLCLTGCGLFPTNTSKLKQLLEDKYGEEFGVESHYFAGDMWATCYPESDPTLLFEVRTNAEVTKISHDYYLQTVVARQIEEEYAPLVEQVFPGSYLSAEVWAVDYEGQTADKVTLESMLEYKNSSSDDDEVGWTHIILNIFVDTSQMSEENIEAEYAFLKDEIGGRVANGEFPDTIIKLYFGDGIFVQECENIIKEMSWRGNSDIYDKTDDCPEIWIGYYDNGEIDYTFDLYTEKRMEALNNE